MEQVEKITFIYPTLIRPGMPATGTYYPDASINIMEDREVYTIALTAGMVFKNLSLYMTEIDILLDGESVAISGDRTGEVVVVASDVPDMNHAVYISSMIMNVKLPKPGLYTATIKLFMTKEREKFGEPIDEMHCNFYASSLNGEK